MYFFLPNVAKPQPNKKLQITKYKFQINSNQQNNKIKTDL